MKRTRSKFSSVVRHNNIPPPPPDIRFAVDVNSKIHLHGGGGGGGEKGQWKRNKRLARNTANCSAASLRSFN